jgi:hypothetical protein
MRGLVVPKVNTAQKPVCPMVCSLSRPVSRRQDPQRRAEILGGREKLLLLRKSLIPIGSQLLSRLFVEVVVRDRRFGGASAENLVPR